MSNATLVYSSETGRIKQDKTISRATQPAKQPVDGTVRLRREVKGRGGGTVIVITGIPLAFAELKELAGALKKRCGCGGTVKDGIIEIQGDHRDILLGELQTRGYKVKLAGG
ncbi:MAG TPA: stress response translation initiation inhibitor YciH [Desulfuromonadaceae bacterium]